MDDAGHSNGDAAEATVVGVMTGLQERHGCHVLHGVLLGKMTEKGPVTAYLDHAIVDPCGILVIEVKSAKDATIRGRYTDRTWSARYPEGRTEILHNPIQENDQRVGLVHEMLTAAGWGLTLDHVRGLVVFADADISELELDSVSAARVTDLARLMERYESRSDFAVCAPLPAEQVGRLAAALRQLDVSQAPDFARAQTDELEIPGIGTREPEQDGAVAPEPPARLRVDPHKAGQVATLVLALIALVVGATLAVNLLRSLSTRSGADFEPEQTPAAAPPSQPAAAPAVEQEPQDRIKPDIELAKKRLKETYAGHYYNLSDPDEPNIIDVAAGQITYEWEYVEKSASNAIVIGKVSITLNAEGKVIGSSD